MLSDAIQFTPHVLHQMKDLIKLHNPDKFLKDSSFGSNFSVAIILDLFWVVFHEICTKTFPVMQPR